LVTLPEKTKETLWEKL
jgi:hypothetical protein